MDLTSSANLRSMLWKSVFPPDSTIGLVISSIFYDIKLFSCRSTKIIKKKLCQPPWCIWSYLRKIAYISCTTNHWEIPNKLT